MKNKQQKHSPNYGWKKIPVPPFRRGICVLVGTPQECIDFIRAEFGDVDGVTVEQVQETMAGALAMNICLPNGESIVYSDKPFTPDRHGTLIHELCHATAHMLTSCCIDYSTPANEAFAYTLEYLYEEATK